ncbi:MAG: phosphotransferase [Halieaceae bacterium]
MDPRQEQLRDWALQSLAQPAAGSQWTAVAGDASGRRYFRLQLGAASWICVDTPPATEKNPAFLHIRELLAAAGLPVPQLHAAELERGFLLLQDLGDTLLFDRLSLASPAHSYDPAFGLLQTLQGIDGAGSGLELYSAAILREEFSRFYQWFCLAWLQLDAGEEDAALVRDFGEMLIDAASAQPQVLVHRDYHSRNLLVQADDSLAIIDFQDAVIGPLCYDLVSLLRDCYIRWPAAQVRSWALDYRQRLLSLGRPAGEDEDSFLRWFDWVGLHRHIKVLGNFTRLSLRDGKHGYLSDIPMVLDYVREVLAAYPELDNFRAWFDTRLQPLIAEQEWVAGA